MARRGGDEATREGKDCGVTGATGKNREKRNEEKEGQFVLCPLSFVRGWVVCPLVLWKTLCPFGFRGSSFIRHSVRHLVFRFRCGRTGVRGKRRDEPRGSCAE